MLKIFNNKYLLKERMNLANSYMRTIEVELNSLWNAILIFGSSYSSGIMFKTSLEIFIIFSLLSNQTQIHLILLSITFKAYFSKCFCTIIIKCNLRITNQSKYL